MKKFKISEFKKSTCKTVRFPNDLIEKIEATLTGNNCSFSAFVIAGTKFALENLQEEDSPKQNK